MRTDEEPTTDTNEELATIKEATPEKGFKIPCPPENPEYHLTSKGFVGDYD